MKMMRFVLTNLIFKAQLLSDGKAVKGEGPRGMKLLDSRFNQIIG